MSDKIIEARIWHIADMALWVILVITLIYLWKTGILAPNTCIIEPTTTGGMQPWGNLSNLTI